MVVRVLIDRKIRERGEADFLSCLRQLRSKAIGAKGYVSGETLRLVDDPQNYVVVSTWQSMEDWKEWEKNPDRKKINDEIERLVVRPTVVKVCSHG